MRLVYQLWAVYFSSVAFTIHYINSILCLDALLLCGVRTVHDLADLKHLLMAPSVRL